MVMNAFSPPTFAKQQHTFANTQTIAWPVQYVNRAIESEHHQVNLLSVLLFFIMGLLQNSGACAGGGCNLEVLLHGKKCLFLAQDSYILRIQAFWFGFAHVRGSLEQEYGTLMTQVYILDRHRIFCWVLRFRLNLHFLCVPLLYHGSSFQAQLIPPLSPHWAPTPVFHMTGWGGWVKGGSQFWTS